MDPRAILEYLASLPPSLTYLVIGAGAAVENIVPPIPADTFVLLGAFIAASGRASPWLVFLVTWGANVASAIGVYGLSRKYGAAFFERAPGRWLLRRRQLQKIGGFYQRHGTLAILFSRFLPAFRAIVPVFAGVSRVPLLRVALPMAAASAGWYGMLVVLGTTAGRNLDAIFAVFDRASLVLLGIAVILIAFAVRWWWRTRHEPHPPADHHDPN
jgi:membrane protein DedA with SNARE-associated domain